jgi:hypothetical protein
MTAIVTQAVAASLASATYETLSATFGAVGIVILLLALIAKEVARSRPAGRQRVLQVFDIVVWPLSMAFGVVILMRLLSLLGV